MKHLITGLFIFLITVAFLNTPVAKAGNEKIGFINVEKVFDEYQKTKDNDAVLQEAGKAKEQERNVLVDEIRKMKDELELLSDDAKKKKEETLTAKVRELQDFDVKARRELGEKRRMVVQEIFADIDGVVKAYGKKKGYSMIFNDKALVYKKDNLDITDVVLKEVNSKYVKSK